jgi:hypothetical protein
MRGEPVLADLDPVGEAAFDHVPAERALREAEAEDCGQRPGEATRDAAADEKIEKRHGVDEADQPPP